MSKEVDAIFEEARSKVRATTVELAELEKLCAAVMTVLLEKNEALSARVRELEGIISSAEKILGHQPVCAGDTFLTSLASLEHGYRQLEAELARVKRSATEFARMKESK